MKEIHLTQGKVALVDDEDYEWLSQWKWCATRTPYTYYAMRSRWVNGKDKTTKMHRVIMDAPPGMHVDHINHNGLDNRKENMRVCTRTENIRNSRKQRRCTSEYKGVCWHKHRNKWITRITADKKSKYLGYFKKETDAALAYNLAALKYFGEFANINAIKERKL